MIPVLTHRNSAALMAARCGTCLRTLRSEPGERAMAGTRGRRAGSCHQQEPAAKRRRAPPMPITGGQDAPGTLALYLINFLDTPPQALQAVRKMALEVLVRRAVIDARCASGI